MRLDPSSIGNLSLFFDIRFDEVVELLQHQRMRKDCQLREFFLDFRCIRNALNRLDDRQVSEAMVLWPALESRTTYCIHIREWLPR